MPSGLTPKAAAAVAGACVVAFGGSYALASSTGGEEPAEPVGVPARALELPGAAAGPELSEAKALPALAAPPPPPPAPVPVAPPDETFTDTEADSLEPPPVTPAPVTPAPVTPAPVTPAPPPPPGNDGVVDFDDSG